MNSVRIVISYPFPVLAVKLNKITSLLQHHAVHYGQKPVVFMGYTGSSITFGKYVKMCVSNVSSRTVLDECTEPVLVGMSGLRGV